MPAISITTHTHTNTHTTTHIHASASAHVRMHAYMLNKPTSKGSSPLPVCTSPQQGVRGASNKTACTPHAPRPCPRLAPVVAALRLRLQAIAARFAAARKAAEEEAQREQEQAARLAAAIAKAMELEAEEERERERALSEQAPTPPGNDTGAAGHMPPAMRRALPVCLAANQAPAVCLAFCLFDHKPGACCSIGLPQAECLLFVWPVVHG